MLMIWFVIFVALATFNMFFAWQISAKVERLVSNIFLGYILISVITLIIIVIKETISQQLNLTIHP